MGELAQFRYLETVALFSGGGGYNIDVGIEPTGGR